MNRLLNTLAVTFLILSILGVLIVVNYDFLIGKTKQEDQKPFYVGVTYCGTSVPEAKILIDRVKNYTNLFVLQSGPLQREPTSINEICDYATACGLNVIIYFGSDMRILLSDWLETYDGRWGEKFLGIYFGDELGGKILDDEMKFHDSAGYTFLKMHDGSISNYLIDNHTKAQYKQDGTIILTNSTIGINGTVIVDPNSTNSNFIEEAFENRKDLRITYYPNSTTTIVQINYDLIGPIREVEDASNISMIIGEGRVNVPVEVEEDELTYSYDYLINLKPLQDIDEVSVKFVEEVRAAIERAKTIKTDVKFSFFTSDYALYWFDYKSGYDVVLAQLGWNHTTQQDIALVRGAATQQNKTWGTIITWKYNQPPYLACGNEIFEQMYMSYKAGAEYIVIFNYAKDMQGPYGTLTDDHFEALECFWTEIVQNPQVKNGEITGQTALVLPLNYGWGMRHPNDTVWGLWQPTPEHEGLWELVIESIKKYDLSLDIAYEDLNYPLTGKYRNYIFDFKNQPK